MLSVAYLKELGLVASLFVFVVAGLVLWSNRQRRVNQAVFGCSINIGAWLLLLYLAVSVSGRLAYLRAACAVSAFVPMNFAMVRDAIIAPTIAGADRYLKRYGLWLAVALALAVLCFTDAFIPSHSTPSQRVRAWGYYAYIGGVLALNLIVLYRTLWALKSVHGARRLELEVWLIGGCTMQLVILATMTLNAFVRNPIFILLQPVIVLTFYGGTAYAITTHRIFEAGQILRMIVRQIAVVGSAALAGSMVFKLLTPAVVPLEAFLTAMVTVLVCARLVGDWLNRRFDFFPQANAARRAAFEISGQEVRLDRIERRFNEILMGWGQAEHAAVLSGTNCALGDGPLAIALEDPALKTLLALKWATPERLAREKNTAGRAELAQLLAVRRWGVAVVVRGPATTVLCGVGVPASRRPFAYPQVMQLLELAAIFQGPLERAHLAEKMQHAEQLATVGMLGASLAHEIRNPLVSLKAFVQLLPTRYHEAAFRDKFFVLMTDEVKRIDRLTEQLLDLASPRAYSAQMVDLNAVVRAGLDLVAARAQEAEVAIRMDLAAAPDRVSTDPAAVKQVLLNLCLNAIQVLEGQPERWLKVVTAAASGGVELTVSDSGPGIAPEIRGRLFQPFQSTKSSGFGLGLAICRDILAGLDATIDAEPAQAGQGATFRVVFPCPR